MRVATRNDMTGHFPPSGETTRNITSDAAAVHYFSIPLLAARVIAAYAFRRLLLIPLEFGA